jgi:hypothetical protein
MFRELIIKDIKRHSSRFTNGIYFVGFEVLTAVVMKSYIFWDIMLCSPLKVNRRYGGTCHLHHQGRRMSQAKHQREGLCFLPTFRLVYCLAYSSTLKMEPTCSSETSIDFQRSIRHYIPEDRTLRHKFCLKSRVNVYFLVFILRHCQDMEYILSNARMNYGLERIWKEAVA